LQAATVERGASARGGDQNQTPAIATAATTLAASDRTYASLLFPHTEHDPEKVDTGFRKIMLKQNRGTRDAPLMRTGLNALNTIPFGQ
jgi:hypothetical protein